MSAPVRPWHLALLPAVVAANYLLMAVRHEAAHGAVVLAFGGEVAEFHVWPPRGANLSWITFRLPLEAPPVAVPLQAMAPFLVALALLLLGVRAARRLPAGILRANVIVSLVVFPCCEIAANVVGYWYAPNDLYWALGGRTAALRSAAAATGAVVVAAALGAVAHTLAARPAAPEGMSSGG